MFVDILEVGKNLPEYIIEHYEMDDEKFSQAMEKPE